jgi:C4-dicarboxylate-specific signal transduction histidine kinase
MGRWAERLEIEQSTNALQQALEINTLVLRGIIARNDYLPYAIAGHPDIAAVLKKPENKAMVQSVNTNFSKLQEKAASSTVIFLLDHTGTTIASSNWNDPHSFVGENYSQRPYFQNALQGQRSYFYGLGLTTGIPGLFIAEPVRANNRIVGVLVVKVGLETLEAAWVNSVDPVTLQDSRGIVFLSSEQEWMFRSEIKLDEPNIDWLSEHGQYGNRRSYQLLNWNKTPVGERGTFLLTAWIDKKHKKYLAQSSIIPELNWKLTVTTDYQAIESARQEAQVIATLISAVLVLAVLIWRLQEKRRMDHERSQVEREQREKELQLQRSARLASVGEMASTLAHELNQPLIPNVQTMRY